MTGTKVVAVHQPNFFPWLGYFDKLTRADVFVLLDDAQFPKTGGTWINRVRLHIGGEATWVTMPVERAYSGVRQIREMVISNKTPWRRKLLRTLEVSYGPAPHFREVFAFLEPLVERPTQSVLEFNLGVIRTLTSALGGHESKLVLSSTLDVAGGATERLVNLVKAVGGTTYLSGDGSAGYQENELFERAGVALGFQQFQHPVYEQKTSTTFARGLSIIDALMNCGFEGTARLLGVKR